MRCRNREQAEAATHRLTGRRGRALVAAAATIALVAGSAIGLGSPSGAASPPATPSPVPTGPSANQLNGVSCPSATRCYAVGQSAAAALVEAWNGTSWSVAVSPEVIGATLAAVACPSTKSCFAVGRQLVSGSKRTLIEQWNGTTWSIVTSPDPSGATGGQLEGVACTSPTFCVAVGTQFLTGAVASKTLVERWNGTKWSITTSPNPVGTRGAGLHGVSCSSTLGCFAVGGYKTASGALRTLIERWNGTKWGVVANPSQGAALAGELRGVSCSSVVSCFAVGEAKNSTSIGGIPYDKALALSERWDGTTWSVVAPRNNGRYVNQLRGVSCTSATSCLAVGSVQVYAPDELGAFWTRVQRWNGKGWSIVTSPNPGETENRLAAVSCFTGTSCVAVGRATNSAFERSLSNMRTLAERWNGSSWATMSTPNPVNAPFAVFDGVSCTSATNCIAVGNRRNAPGRNNTVVQRWDGTTWTIVASPNPAGATISQLAGVSCTSATNCVAVGRYTTSTSTSAADAGPFKTLVEQWNGTTWSIVSSPNPAGATFARLDRVSCADATSCMAIGVASTTSSGTDKPLAERWNGTAWSIVPSVGFYDPTGKTMGLSGVSCTSATHCLAVYSASDGGWQSTLLTEQWDGTTWSPGSPSPYLIELDETMSGVSCTSETVCMVTGAYTRWIGVSFVFTTTLVEQVNGSDWTVVCDGCAASSQYAHPRLDAVSCTGDDSCISVGARSSTRSTYDPPRTLAARWDGSGWTLVASPNPAGAAASQLASVSCATPTSCIAVGDYQVARTGETKPLTERWNGTAWSIVAAAVP